MMIVEQVKTFVGRITAVEADLEQKQEEALQKAQELLAKHNVAMTGGEVDKEDRDVAEIAEEFPCPWRRVVAGAVANLCLCRFYAEPVPGKQKYKFNFVGLESNAHTAKTLTEFLIKSIFRESERQKKAKGETTLFGTNFRNLAGTRIEAKCESLRAECAELASLYPLDDAANDTFIEKILGVKLTQRKIKGSNGNRALAKT